MPATKLEIELNGVRREVREGLSVADLVLDLGLRPEIVAVEVNQDLVTRDRRASTILRSGDRVELVTMVGGG
jgi:thiamine biosynthesis protein ThiS